MAVNIFQPFWARTIHMMDFIQTFGILLLIITLISFVIKLFKQPIIIGYVLAGVAFASIFHSQAVNEQVVIFSEIGITFLLFLMGLEFDLKSLKYLGKDIFVATILQCLIFFGMAFGLALAIGFEIIQAVYLGLLFAFTSTLLVAKWLGDKKDSESLHGKIVMGVLIIEDIICILVLTVMSIMKEDSIGKILLVPFEGLALLALAFVFSRFLLNRLLKFSMKYPELLFILSLSICFLFAILAARLGYSTTIGAFIGGVVLANTLFKTEIHTRLKPLVTFFNMLFFVGLGFNIQLDLSLKVILFIAALIVLSVTIRPFIVYFNFRIRGYDLKTSFLTAVYLIPMSEFAIIIFASGAAEGFLDMNMTSIAIIAVILTMILSSYLIKFDKKIFKAFEKTLIRLDKKFIVKTVPVGKSDLECNILFFGYYEISKGLLTKFQELGKKIVVIENDPENLALLRQEGIRCVYSSVNDPEFFEHINFEKVELTISSLTDMDDNKLIIKKIKKNNPKAIIIVTARHLKESIELYNNDADYVLYSSYLNEQKVSVLLEEYTADINKLLEKKVAEMAKLKEKEEKIKTSKERGFYDVNTFLRKAKEAKKELAKASSEPDNKKKTRFSFFDVKRFTKKK